MPRGTEGKTIATAALYDAWLANALGSTSSGNAPNTDYLSDTIACTLHTSTYTPDKTTHDFVNDLTNEVATAGGYTAGGQNLASKTLAITSSVVVLDAADVVWAASTITARHAVLSDRTPGTAATQPLIGYQNNGTDAVSTGGDFSVIWSTSPLGLARISIAAEA